jgi:hypothetical protein
LTVIHSRTTYRGLPGIDAVVGSAASGALDEFAVPSFWRRRDATGQIIRAYG